ncbi:MAG: MBL fold metallo-hydrolase [Bacteroidota bacterium]
MELLPTDFVGRTMNLTISGFSTALFSTWYFIDELGLLFDVGDGVSAHLLQKARKIKHVFVSHADRDHVSGLLQFNQLNAREGFPIIYYPKNSGSFPAMADFSAQFDPHASGTVWRPIAYDEIIFLQKDLSVQAIRNEHLPFPPNIVKSMSFHVRRHKRKLKKEFHGLQGSEIAKLRTERGDDFVTHEVVENILSYSGDTPVVYDGRFENTHTLIHEATFLRIDETVIDKDRANKHSTLEGVLRMVKETKVQRLVLGHFSCRYSIEEIDAEIRCLVKSLGITIPVYRVPPGVCVRDIISIPPIC